MALGSCDHACASVVSHVNVVQRVADRTTAVSRLRASMGMAGTSLALGTNLDKRPPNGSCNLQNPAGACVRERTC